MQRGVRLALESGRPIAHVARDIGLPPEVLRKRVRQAGVYRLSRRQVREVVSEIFGIAISTGVVDAAIMRISEILKDPFSERDLAR